MSFLPLLSKTRPLAIGLTLGLWLTASSALAHGPNDPHDGPQDISKIYDFTGFDSLSITGVYELDVTVGGDYALTLSGPEKEMRRITVTQEEKTLILGHENTDKGTTRNSRDSVLATLTLPNLNALEIAGVSTGKISGVESDRFLLDIGGVGEVEISGTCGILDADIAGVGAMVLKDLKCKSATVNLAGVGELSVYASEQLDVSAAGIGGVNVYGNPKSVNTSKSLLSSIKFYDE